MANPKHFETLLQAQKSTNIWNGWRKENPRVYPDLSHINGWQSLWEEIKEGDTPSTKKREHQTEDEKKKNLPLSLAGADLQNLDLRGVLFINTDLQEADFRGANLEKAYFAGARLNGAIFHGVNLQGANFQNAELKDADFSQAQMQRVTLTGADLSGAILIGADLCDAQMEEVDLSDAQLESSNLSRAKLRWAKLNQADLNQAQLRGTVLREADLKDADLEDALGLTEEQLAGTNLEGATLPPSVRKERIYQFDEKLNRIENASHNLQTLFLVLLASCMYCLLTIASTTHAQLIADVATSPLPIIGAKVSIINFYRVMPFFLLTFYIYLHQNLQYLWDMLVQPGEITYPLEGRFLLVMRSGHPCQTGNIFRPGCTSQSTRRFSRRHTARRTQSASTCE